MDIFWEDNSFGFNSPLLQSPCILRILQQEMSTKQSIHGNKNAKQKQHIQENNDKKEVPSLPNSNRNPCDLNKNYIPLNAMTRGTAPSRQKKNNRHNATGKYFNKL